MLLFCLNAIAISADQERIKADKQAYLETGGTEKEWKKYKPQVTVSYQVKTNSNNYLSFIIVGTRSFENFQSATYYYNLDLKTRSIYHFERSSWYAICSHCQQSYKKTDQRDEER